MTNLSDEVIDLTNSFTLVNQMNMANVVIELDDSLNESTMSQQSITVRYEVGDRDGGVPSEITITSQANETCSVPPLRDRKKNRNSKKKMQLSCQPRNEECSEPIRDRSPVGPQFGECPICFERFGTNRLASTKCGHVYCEQCLLRAIRSEKKCPTCRQGLRGKNAYHPLFLNRK